jgi:hypothetical protein
MGIAKWADGIWYTFPTPTVHKGGLLMWKSRAGMVHIYSTFLRKEQPSVKRALPPVGWQRTVLHEAQKTTVAAWLKTVVIWKQPGHLTSMKKELGLCTRRFNLCNEASCSEGGCNKS